MQAKNHLYITSLLLSLFSTPSPLHAAQDPGTKSTASKIATTAIILASQLAKNNNAPEIEAFSKEGYTSDTYEPQSIVGDQEEEDFHMLQINQNDEDQQEDALPFRQEKPLKRPSKKKEESNMVMTIGYNQLEALLNQRYDRLRDENKEELDGYKKEISGCKKKIAHLQNENKELKTSFHKCKQDIAYLQNENKELKTSLHEAEQDIAHLKSEKKELKTSLHEAEQTVKTQSKKISELKKENKKLIKDQADCKKQCQKLQKEKRELQERNTFPKLLYANLNSLITISATFFGFNRTEEAHSDPQT